MNPSNNTFCHPVMDDAIAASICAALAYGTTARAKEFVCIWYGKHLALVRGIGHNTGRQIKLVERGKTGTGSVETMHKPGSDKRLTRKRIGTLIYKAKVRDAGWTKEQAAKREARQQENDQRRRLYAAQSKVNQTRGLMLEAAMLEDADLLVEAAANYRAAMRELAKVNT